MSKIPDISEIFARCVKGTATQSELAAFYEWAEIPENRDQATRLLENAFVASDGTSDMDAATFESILESILEVNKKQVVPLPAVHRIHMLKKSWLRYAAALIILAGVGTYIWMRGSDPVSSPGNGNAPTQLGALEDVAPGSNGAVLTLADGSTIVLDSVANGSLPQQGSTNVVKLAGGQIAYKADASGNQTQEIYNTITTPKGRQFEITLSDGSKVWLNASSSIKFPTIFYGNKRSVTVTGEVYFEVSHDSNKPFYVNTEKVDVQVLGTSFNINTYPDEASVNTTLLEGSLKVISKKMQQPGTLILTPGQQSRVNQTGDNKLVKNANTEQVMAWKNGAFRFQDKSLEEVMRELSRWYDIEVVYEKGIPAIEFGGEMGRNLKLGQVLKSLGDAGLNFKMEKEKRLVILP